MTASIQQQQCEPQAALIAACRKALELTAGVVTLTEADQKPLTDARDILIKAVVRAEASRRSPNAEGGGE